MKKKAFFKFEGVSLNAAHVAALTKEQWAKHAKDAGFFTSYAGKTPTKEQFDELVNKSYELAQKQAGNEPAKPAAKKPEEK